MDLIESLNVSLVEDGISIAHRLLPKRGQSTSSDKQHPPITVRFLSRYKKNEVHYKRFNAKDINEYPVNGMDRPFINENLTQKRKQLFWQTKQKAKELNYKFIWTFNGQIFIRKNVRRNKIQVKSVNDLNNL